jgi:hypothetical protein
VQICSVHVGDEKRCPKVCLEALRGTDHSEDPDTDVRIILKWISGK